MDQRTKAIRDLGSRLYKLALGLRIVQDAEERMIHSFPTPSTERPSQVPLLILPACPRCPGCDGRLSKTNNVDCIPRSTAIVNHSAYSASVVSARCKKCKLTVFADRVVMTVESDSGSTTVDAVVPSATMIRIHRTLFVDRRFASHIVSQIHHSRASFASASKTLRSDMPSLASFDSERVQRCFLEETIRRVAADRGPSFGVDPFADNELLADAAYKQLANGGQLPCLEGHRCSGCSIPAREAMDDAESLAETLEVSDQETKAILETLGPPRRHRAEKRLSAVVVDATYMGPLASLAWPSSGARI